MKTKSILASIAIIVALASVLGNASAATVFPITTNGSGSQAGLFAAFAGTNYLFGIQGDGTTDNTNITAQLVATNGVVVGPRISMGRKGGIPYVAFGGTNYVLVWSDDALVGSGGNDQVYGQFISGSGARVGSPFTFGPTSEEQDMAGGGGSLLASDGNNFLVVWDTGAFHDAPSGDVHAALFNHAGGLVEPIIDITSDGDVNAELTPAVCFGQTNYLVVWNDEGSGYIDGAFISTNGTAGTPFVISETPTTSYNPLCAAFDGTNFLVIWNLDVGTDSTVWNLYGRLVSPDGTFPGNEVPMVSGTNNPEFPSLAFGGGNYLLSWNEGAKAGNSQIFFQYFQPTPSLPALGPAFHAFSNEGANAPLFSGASFDGNRFVIGGVLGQVTGLNAEGLEFTGGTATWGAFVSNFTFTVSAPLTLRLAGVGTITPNDSNAVLQVGASYNLTAAAVPGSGYVFSNWTGGTSQPLAWLTNGTTVEFVMASNLVLQANFVDTNRPVFAITNESQSGGSFVVSGTNKGVAQIFGRLNGSGWTAGTVNVNNRTWTWTTAQTNVLPGTNYLQIYAESASGIFSPTNSTNYFLAVPAVLRVQTNGVAVLTPNYNGELLFLGRNYSITAVAGKGFKFTNWTGGTSLPLGLITNGTTVQFMMQSNLMLAASLVETSRPTLTISAPVNGQHMSNALALVSGTAGDNWKVTGVWCQVNSNGWALAVSTNRWTNWSAVLTLRTGTNTIRGYAADLGGNFSPTNSVSVVSSNTFKLWLSLTNFLSGQGNGKVFSLVCSTGLWGHIEYSTNLVDWNVLTNFAGTNGSVTFRDSGTTNSTKRFYRAVIP